MKGKIIVGLLALISFGIGANIYTDLRGYNFGLFQWVDNLFPFILLDTFGGWSDSSFVLYYLPDALWMYSFALVIMLIWGLRWTKELRYWLVGALVIGLGYEELQLSSIVPGTFDIYDLIIILVAFGFSLFTLLLLKPKT
jgi:hypothetical protein